jgi:PAS domain S-box-containing protein
MSTIESIVHILVVEDESGHAELIRRAFEGMAGQYIVSVASTIKDAQHLAARRKPDLALVDYRLPDGLGNAVIALGKDTFPVIILTSHGDEKLAVQAIKAGAIDYVAKSPESFETLPHVADRALREWHSMQDRKMAEEALKRSETRQGKMISNISDVIVIIDQEGINRYKSPNIEKWFGWKPEEIIGSGALENVHPDDIDSAQKFIASILGQPNNSATTECRYRCKDGNYKWIEFTGVNLLHDPDIHGLLGNYHDISERRQAEENLRRIEERLRQSEKMEAVGQLAGGIAHDFNNVLGGIIGYTDISLGYVEKGSMLESNLLKVLKASDRAKNLVKQILAFSRRDNPQMTATALRPIVKEVLDLLRSSIPSSVSIESDLQKDVKTVIADPTQIHQTLLNLATNAVHSMNRKGTLTVRLYTVHLDTMAPGQIRDIVPGEYTVIEVADTGCGMDAVTLSRAFEPFFTTKPMGEGCSRDRAVARRGTAGGKPGGEGHNHQDVPACERRTGFLSTQEGRPISLHRRRKNIVCR